MFSKPQIFPMNQSVFLLLLLLSVLCFVQAQSAPGQSSNFQPSLAVVIGIMAIMFSLTFILIVYAKFCHEPANAHNDREAVQSPQIPNGFVRQNSLYRGIDKTVIESIPFFRFSSLRGSRRGLECVVCLSKFEDVEILRLLPKCKHAFHIGCIDEWLEKHSSCPLCRVKISADDLATITYTDSMRFLSSQVEVVNQVIDDPGVQLYVQREGSSRSWSSRFRNSLRRSGSGVMKHEELPIRENDGAVDKEDSSMHKFNHKIIVSDVVLKKRWSYLSSSDLAKLNSEMLGDVSRKRFSCLDTNTLENSTTWATEEGGIRSEINEETGRKTGFEPKVGKLNRNNSFPSSSDADSSNQSRVLNTNDRRSMSEITVFSRFKRNGNARESPVAQNGGKEERLKRLWQPIAERTVRWYGDRDKRSQQSNNMRESLNV
ncbi:putative RING-H2 finger protein ATL12 [Rhododendron vialii]|uniref:putative RING-H2 finger protein ATL12 n=1 Tax=Rhododendron vialii TaxID=182163 RepID=UPI00265FFA9B|nr:putative RING-H2 finger protein ATL12 [Rhododendron vialii]